MGRIDKGDGHSKSSEGHRHLDSEDPSCYLRDQPSLDAETSPAKAFQIVEAGVAHIEGISTLSQEIFSQESWDYSALEKELALDFSHCCVADSGGGGSEEVLGYLLFWMVLDEVQILQVATNPLHRRRGIGRALLADCMRWGRGRGATVFFLEVRGSNTGALVLYRDMGFKEIALRRSYYRDPEEDAVIMMCGSGR